MSRYLGSKIRQVRRMGELPGLTRKTTTRNRAPGQHDRRPGTLSDFGIRLIEKQKLRYNYGLSESQLYGYLRKARRLKGSTGLTLLQLIEMRLDNIVFRLGFAPTIQAARQLISHGHVCVNGKIKKSPSAHCLVGETIQIKDKSKDFVSNNKPSNSLVVKSEFLNPDNENLKGVVKNLINREQVGLDINELLVVEFYSRK